MSNHTYVMCPKLLNRFQLSLVLQFRTIGWKVNVILARRKREVQIEIYAFAKTAHR
jgi:hypothetical protein